MNHAQIKSTLLEALRRAGGIIKASLKDRPAITKKSELSLVTETDKAAEAAVIETIRKSFPDHAFLAEESAAQGQSPHRWIIDPLDGTTNFAHTYPVACVSIGFESAGTILAGGVYDPFRDELFYAEKGKGAFLNGSEIRVSATDRLTEALLCTGFPYDRKTRSDEYLEIFKIFLKTGQGIRRSGAAALDLCYVAAGRFDGFWEFQLQPWDKAAGMLIIEEAGGRLSNFSGDPLTLEDGQNAVSNGKIHDAMLSVLKKFEHIKK